MLAGRKGSPSAFHNGTVYAIARYEDCISQHSLRKCIYDTQLYDETLLKGWVSICLYTNNTYPIVRDTNTGICAYNCVLRLARFFCLLELFNHQNYLDTYKFLLLSFHQD